MNMMKLKNREFKIVFRKSITQKWEFYIVKKTI